MTSLDFDREMSKRDSLTNLFECLTLKDDNSQGHTPLLSCSFPSPQLSPLA